MLYFAFLVIYRLATDLLPTPVRPWPSPRMMGLVIGLVLRHLYGQSWPWPWPWLSGLVLGLVLGLPVLNTTLVTAHPLLLPDAGWCSRKHPIPQIGRTMEILCKERHTICTLKNPSHSSIPKSRVKPIAQSRASWKNTLQGGPSLWTSGTKCLYCLSNLSNLGLKLLKKISILSQTCLGQNVSIWSQFETFLTFETQLRLPPFESNLRAIWDIILRCQKGVKKVSKMSQKGIWGDLVDGRSFQVPSLYIQTLWFHT